MVVRVEARVGATAVAKEVATDAAMVAGREVAMEVVVMARRWGRQGRWQAWRWR